MSRKVRISFYPTNNVYKIYTGLTSLTITGLTINSVVDECTITFSNSLPQDVVWIKCTTPNCDDQIFEVYIGSS